MITLAETMNKFGAKRYQKEMALLVLLTTGLCLFLHYLPVKDFTWDVADTFSIGLLLTVGLVHGAFDLYLDVNKATPEFSKIHNRIKWYLFFIVISAILFLSIRGVGLLLFILISAYHFGQQSLSEIEGYPLKSIIAVFWAFYGLSVVLLMFYTHFSEVQLILKDITGHRPGEYFMVSLLVFTLAVQALALLYLKFKSSIGFLDWILFQSSLIMLFWFFSLTSLLVSFTFYFIFWHSVPSIRQQVENNYGRFNFSTVLRFLKKAAPFWMIFLIVLFLGVFLLPYRQITHYFIPLVMAAIIPHVLLMDKVLQQR